MGAAAAGDTVLQPAAVRVPCSTSNLGAGFDCLGLAFQRYLDATYQPRPHARGGLAIEYGGTLAPLAQRADDIITGAFLDRLAQHGVREAGGLLFATSQIPVARGLGSSAAATVAGLMLAELALGREPDPVELLRSATAREGHPDNAAPALLGGLVAVARDGADAPVAFRLPLAGSIRFVYAAPEIEVATPAARAALPEQVPHALAGRGLGRMAALVHGLATGDPALLRLGLLDELHVPHRLPLIPRAQEALRAATEAGAWGATISGSGSGLIALCPEGSEDAVQQAMQHALEADDVASLAFAATADTDGARSRQLEPAG